MSERSQKRAAERSAARLGAVMALYQMDSAGTPIDTVIEEFELHRFGTVVDGVELPMGDTAFFAEIVRGVLEYQRQIDKRVNAILKDGWRLDRLDSMLRALLRAGAYELLYREDVPPKVSISEYVRMSEAYFDDNEVGFVNGALDRLGKAHRAAELSS